MDVCEVWLAADFLRRRGFTIAVDAAGQHIATRDGNAPIVLPGVCAHPPEQCPPHGPEQRLEAAA